MFVPLVEIHSTLVSDAEVFPILRAKFSAKFTAVIPVYCYCFGMEQFLRSIVALKCVLIEFVLHANI